VLISGQTSQIASNIYKGGLAQNYYDDEGNGANDIFDSKIMNSSSHMDIGASHPLTDKKSGEESNESNNNSS